MNVFEKFSGNGDWSSSYISLTSCSNPSSRHSHLRQCLTCIHICSLGHKFPLCSWSYLCMCNLVGKKFFRDKSNHEDHTYMKSRSSMKMHVIPMSYIFTWYLEWTYSCNLLHKAFLCFLDFFPLLFKLFKIQNYFYALLALMHDFYTIDTFFTRHQYPPKNIRAVCKFNPLLYVWGMPKETRLKAKHGWR